MTGTLALLSLVTLVLPFFLPRRSETRDRGAWMLGVFWIAVILVSFTARFPVPVLGFGAGPLIGIALAAACAAAPSRFLSRS